MPYGEDGQWRPFTPEEVSKFGTLPPVDAATEAAPPKLDLKLKPITPSTETPPGPAPAYISGEDPTPEELTELQPTFSVTPEEIKTEYDEDKIRAKRFEKQLKAPQSFLSGGAPAPVSGENPTQAELNEIGFDIAVDPEQGVVPQYDKEKLRDLRRKTAKEYSLSPGGAMGLATSAGTTGFVPQHLEKYREEQQDIVAAFEESDHKTNLITQKARKKGFAALSEDELTWIENEWSPEEASALYALTADHGFDIPEKVAKSLAAGGGQKPLTGLPTPGVGFGLTAGMKLLGRESDQPETPITYSPGEIDKILGKTEGILHQRAKAREIIQQKENRQRAADNEEVWDGVVAANAKSLSIPARELVVRDYMDGRGHVDINALREELTQKIQLQILQEETGRGWFSPDLSPEIRDAAYGRAAEQASLDVSVILNAGRGGLAWVDPDPMRTTEKIIGYHKAFRDFWDVKEPYRFPELDLLAKSQATEKGVDLLLIPRLLVGPAIDTLGDLGPRLIKDNPLILPLLTATTPAMAIDVTPTHREFVSRTVMDSINGWMVTTWIGAALATHSDMVKEKGLPEDAYGEATFRMLNQDLITKESGSEVLGEVSTALAGGNPDEAGFGLAKIMIGNNPAVAAKTESSLEKEYERPLLDSAWDAVKGQLNTAADIYETFVGSTGDDVKTRRMIQNLRNGNMLFQVQAEVANDFSDAMGLEGWQRDAVIRSAMFSGLVSEFTPGFGADGLTPFIAQMGRGIQGYRAYQASLRSQGKILAKIRNSKNTTASEKLEVLADQADPQVTRMVKENLLAETKYRGSVSEYIGRTEHKLERALTESQDAARTAGIEESPQILEGSKFTDEAYKKDYIEKRVARETQEPSIPAQMAGRGQSNLGLEVGNVDDAIDRLEAAGELLPEGIRGWEAWKKEQYIQRLNRDHIQESLRKNIETEIREEVAGVGARIGNTTVDGDVYKLTDSDGSFGLYMRMDNDQWVRVDEADIPILRERVLIGETTRTPLRPIERKSQQTGQWEQRARQADEYPWSQTEAARVEAEKRVTKLQKQLKASQKAPAEDTNRILDSLDQAEAELSKLRADEQALRKTFPDHTAPGPEAVGRIPQTAYDEMAADALTNTEMVGATAHSVRKPVFATGKDSPEVVQYNQARLDAAREHLNLAETEAIEARKALQEWEASEGGFLTEVQATRGALKNEEKKLRKIIKTFEKQKEAAAPLMTKESAQKATLDAADADVVRKTSEWKAKPTEASKKALKDARKKANKARRDLEQTQLELLPHQKVHQKISSDIALSGIRIQQHQNRLIGVRTDAWNHILQPHKGPGLEVIGGKKLEKELGKIKEQLVNKAKTTSKAVKEANKNYINLAKIARAVPESIQDVTTALQSQLKTLQLQDDLSKLDKVLGNLVADIEAGTTALRSIPNVSGSFNKILNTTSRLLDVDAKAFNTPDAAKTVITREVDAQKMVEELENLFNPATLDRAANFGGDVGNVFKEIVDAAVDGRTVELTAEKSMQLQRLLPLLTDSYKQTHKAARSMNVVEALRLATKDPTLQIRNFTQWVERRMLSTIEDFSDPIRAQIGDSTEAVLQAVKGIDHLQDHLKDELFAIAKNVEKVAQSRGYTPREKASLLQEELFKYLTGTEGLPVYGTRTTYLNMGEISIFDRAVQQITSDPRALGYKRLKKAAKAEQQKLRKQIDAQIRRGELPAGTKPPTVRELIERRWGAGAHEIGKVGTSPVVNALARAFIADGPWKKVDAKMEFRLYETALDSLHRNRNNLGAVIEDVKAATSKQGIDVTSNTTEALQRIANALGHGAIEYRFNRAFTRAIGGRITPEQASDIWKLFGENADDIADYNNALEGLNRIGIPFTARTVVEPGRATERELRLIATGASEAGDTFFLPSQIAQRLESTMPNVVKNSAERFARERGDLASYAQGLVYDYNSLWKTSVVTGIFSPQGRYWWNNFVGDLSQVWFGEGLATALRMNKDLIHTVSLNTMGKTYTGVENAFRWAGQQNGELSFFPKAIADGLARVRQHHVAKYGEEGALGSVYNALLNPVANKIWRGESGILRTKYGLEYSYSELRKLMQDEGVLDTMVHAELMESYYRVTPKYYQDLGIGKALAGAKAIRESITDTASFVQQRQRGNFFMEMVRNGHSPQEAGRKTRAALYDWKHGVSTPEVRVISAISPFWRFFRLAGKQVAGKIMEPLIRPDKAMMQAFMGQSGFSRIQQQWAVNRGWGEFWDPDGYHSYKDELEQWDAMAQYLRPEWSRLRAVTSVRRNTEEEMHRMKYLKQGAQTYSMLVMPPQTALDLTEIMGSIFTGVMMSCIPDGVLPWGGKVTPDAAENVFRPFFDVVFPYMAEPMQGHLKSMGVESGGFASFKHRTRISPGEEILYGSMGGIGTWGGAGVGGVGGALLGFGRARGGPLNRALRIAATGAVGAAFGGAAAGSLEGQVYPHAEDLYPTAPTWAVFGGRLMPFLGTELPNFLDQAFYKNTAAQRAWREDKTSFGGLFQGAVEFLGMNSAIWKPHPFNPDQTAYWNAKAKKDRVRAARKDAKPRAEKPLQFYEETDDE